MTEKRRKKFLSLLLTGCLLLTNGTPAFADVPESATSDSTYTEYTQTPTSESSGLTGETEISENPDQLGENVKPTETVTPTPEQDSDNFTQITDSSQTTITVPKVILNLTELTLVKGEGTELKVLAEEQGDVVSSIQWDSSVPMVAEVDENGRVEALSEGETLITATAEVGGQQCEPVTCRVEVINAEPVLSYQAHVSNIGWQEYVQSGETAGTTGRNLPMEALRINVTGVENIGVKYSAHVQNIGWQDFVGTDIAAGTTGKNLPMEAVKIELTGTAAADYDIYYRAHVTNVGWLDWAKNGQAAGSQGYAYSLQALEIKILTKNSSEAPTNTSNPNMEKLIIYANAHVQDMGWLGKSEIGGMIGTVGKNLNLEALQLTTNNADGIGIEYQAHVRDIGWQSYVANGASAGTTGKNKAIEALKIGLIGDNANQYDIYYRAHITNLGWLDWAKNGEAAGSEGLAYSVQALQIVIVSKGSAAPGGTTIPFCKKNNANYSTYISGIGWQESVSNGVTSGSTGKGRVISGLKLDVSGMENLGVKYSVHVSDVGWMGYVSDGTEAGQPNAGRSIECVKIELTGSASRYFDIWYRVHASDLGWLGWAANGSMAGTAKIACAAEALQILVLPKGSTAPGSTNRAYVDTKAGWTYIDGLRRYKDQNGNILNDVSDIFNPSSKYITVDRKKGITTIYGYNSQTGSYDTPIKSMWCSVGNPITLSKAGTYRMGWQLRTKEMNASDGSYRCWAPYVSQIYGTVYFHGVASDTPDLRTVSAGAFMALGTPQSHGCIRLAAIDAKWIYYNTSTGTTVKIGDNLASPMSPKRYAWRGGALGMDPTYS